MCSILSNAKGETVLIDMKPKAAAEWSGNIYSRDSGNTYYATIAMKGPNSLQVEAARSDVLLLRQRLEPDRYKPERLITYRRISTEPRS